MKRSSWTLLLGPGILVAATGIGAGDLLTASLGGSVVGLSILWAAGVGAMLKWFLNEGIARWQMATGTTLLEGWVDKLGQWIRWVFLGYLLIWSLLTGGALLNACGVAGTGIFPLTGDLKTSKIIWGIIHSLLGLVLVLAGGFKLFERLMSLCIGLMFVTVISAAVLVRPDWTAVARGLLVPSIPPDGMVWLLGILGGVGGTATLLSYGYWIREKNRSGTEGMRMCRIDLAFGYFVTALFGISMIIIGSTVSLSGKGPTVAITLADQLSLSLGSFGRWIFLIGFWGAVFSSLLGVWQSVPYLFADFLSLQQRRTAHVLIPKDLAQTVGYRVYLVALALVSIPLLWGSVEWAQKSYAVLGSLFMPLLSLTLLLMNNRTAWVGKKYRNGWLTNMVLVMTLVFFAGMAGYTIYTKLF